jgi:hypothetical protein
VKVLNLPLNLVSLLLEEKNNILYESLDSNRGIHVLATGEDAESARHAMCINLVLQLLPHLTSVELGQPVGLLDLLREDRKSSEVINTVDTCTLRQVNTSHFSVEKSIERDM